jgi:hypothetical protein
VAPADGAEHAVFEDADGRHFVEGDKSEHVDGAWLAPADEPVVAGCHSIARRHGPPDFR